MVFWCRGLFCSRYITISTLYKTERQWAGNWGESRKDMFLKRQPESESNIFIHCRHLLYRIDWLSHCPLVSQHKRLCYNYKESSAGILGRRYFYCDQFVFSLGTVWSRLASDDLSGGALQRRRSRVVEIVYNNSDGWINIEDEMEKMRSASHSFSNVSLFSVWWAFVIFRAGRSVFWTYKLKRRRKIGCWWAD